MWSLLALVFLSDSIHRTWHGELSGMSVFLTVSFGIPALYGWFLLRLLQEVRKKILNWTLFTGVTVGLLVMMFGPVTLMWLGYAGG
jgi:hypothetical protein